MHEHNFIKKAWLNDPVSTVALVVIAIVLVLECGLCGYVRTTDTGRPTNVSMFVLACSFGSLLGMLASPYTESEKKGFSSTAKLALAFFAGLFTEAVKCRVTDSCLSKQNLFLMAICLSAVMLSFTFSYVLREYVVPNLYEGGANSVKPNNASESTSGPERARVLHRLKANISYTSILPDENDSE